MKKTSASKRIVVLLLFVISQFYFDSINAQTTAAYVFCLGKDTVAYEQYTRNKELIEGQILSLYPRLTINQFRLFLGADGTIKQFESASSYFTGGKMSTPFMQKNGSIEDTIVTQQAFRNGKVDSFFSGKFSVIRGSVPVLDNNDVAMFEQMLIYATLTGKDSIPLNRFTNGPGKSYIKKINKELYESKVFFFPVYIKLKDGQISSVDATSSTIKTIAKRTSAIDFEKLKNTFAEKEKLNGFAGLVSPVDTFRTTFSNTDFQITYNRPYKRGRVIFGNIVPWNMVWRLGANFATHFATSKELRFGDFILPAGRYTIWMIPKQGKDISELVINKGVNIFGTQYDKAKDVIRLPMQTTWQTNLIEQLSIEVKETNEGGEIIIQWDDLQAKLPFKI
jgi:Protein of unknown function (DUF2911)